MSMRVHPVMLGGLLLTTVASCAHTRGARGTSSSQILLELATRPGRWCSATTVTYEGTRMKTERIGCDVEMAFDLIPQRSFLVKMPLPDDRSAPIQRTVEAEGIARRQLTLSDPRGRGTPWAVRVADDVVGMGGIGVTEARRFDLRRHRYLVFDVSDTRRDDGSAFPFRTGIEGMPWEAIRADGNYCASFARDIHVFPALAGPVESRTWPAAQEIDKHTVYCSHTHDNVFVLDLGGREEGTYDIQVTLDNRDPVLFRLAMHPDDNYAVVNVVVKPSEL